MRMIKRRQNEDSIPNIYHMAGMGSKFKKLILDRFHIGFISCMDQGLNSSVRYVGVRVTGGEERLRSIFKNGDMRMG